MRPWFMYATRIEKHSEELVSFGLPNVVCGIHTESIEVYGKGKTLNKYFSFSFSILPPPPIRLSDLHFRFFWLGD